jgi:hypothetical protein
MIDAMPKLSKVCSISSTCYRSSDEVQGYLRCGKVLRLLQKPELALRIYDRGLTKVKIGADDDRTVSVPILRVTSNTNFIEIAIGVQSTAQSADSGEEL